MADPKNVSVRDVLHNKIVATGLYDTDRANELIARIENDEPAMLVLIGRLAVEAERGGSGTQQGIRALVNSNAIPAALETFERTAGHELSDESFPRTPG
jgi:hypothetical protein